MAKFQIKIAALKYVYILGLSNLALGYLEVFLLYDKQFSKNQRRLVSASCKTAVTIMVHKNQNSICLTASFQQRLTKSNLTDIC
jgi:hypothetical protein